MDALRAALERCNPRDPREAGDLERVRRLVDGGGDLWSRATARHVTASALVVDPGGRRVLLRWHARLQRWMQVGGHADPGESDPWVIAVREAQEETGLHDLTPLTPALEQVPVQVVVVPVPAGGGEPAHEHADIRYVFATAQPGRVQAESPDATLRWVGFEEARSLITEPNLLEFVGRVEELLS